MPEHSSIALAIGSNKSTIRDAAGKSLTAISAARRDAATESAPTAISMSAVAGIVSVADALQMGQVALLGIGSPRRAPVEAPDGSIEFTDMVMATLTCDPAIIDAARGAELLSAFKGFVERPVTMIV
jgi:pyruvate dehydrogenase E2 component (dihydrolipoamide acetyltransferase)